VIDLDRITVRARKVDDFTGIWVVERAACHVTVFINNGIFKIPVQNDISRITALERRPALTKLISVIAGFRRATFHLKLSERISRTPLQVLRVALEWHDRLWWHRSHDKHAKDDKRDNGDDRPPQFSLHTFSMTACQTLSKARTVSLRRIAIAIIRYMQTVSRLAHLFSPKNYNLSLTLDRPGRHFHGTMTIQGRSADSATEIRLHAKDLTIDGVTFDGKAAASRADDNDELVISHPDINGGEHVVVVTFSGKITDSMHGLYPCYYEHDGVKKELLATQFESHFAREVFPCIDEPEAKATFDVSLTTEQGVTVLGNMPVKLQRQENDQLVTVFDTTPRMSSYLLAWVVGELQKKSATTKGGVEVNVWATPAQPADSLDFGLDIATRTIDFFDNYFDTPYPFPKSDHVALPDFSSGAMENWGLVTYREVALLVDPKTTSVSNKRMAASVIAHELSHQWFGNLVTMKWWNDLWLNESFANLMEYIAVDALHSEWEIWLEHASYEVLQALRRDSLDGVQSIRTDVRHPDEISTLFDPSIVYAKGGRLLRMLQTYIGDDAFQRGLKAYFKKFAYQNTEADDLWECLSQASGQDISVFMNTWIGQSGYPVIHVSKDGDSVTLSQQQFFVGPNDGSDKIWPIPLNATTSDVPNMLSETSVSFESTQPFRLNTGGNAHFITDYSPELLTELLQQLPSLPVIDRLHLLHEQTLLAKSGIISSADLIDLLGYYKDEEAEAVWDIMSVTIGELKRFVTTDEAAETKLREFTGSLAERQFARLGWDAVKGEPEEHTKLRSTMLGLMLYSERPEIINEALRRYTLDGIAQLDPELRPSILLAAVRYGEGTIVDDLLSLHHSTQSSELKEDIASALTGTKNPEVIQRLIGLFKDKQTIRSQDFPRWFVWLLRNRYGRTLTWQWLRDNWQWVEQTYKGDHSYDMIPRYVASSLVTKDQLEEYTSFFTPLKSEPSLSRNIAIGIKELTGLVALEERDSPAVRRALLEL
jgi:aminopeptidase N